MIDLNTINILLEKTKWEGDDIPTLVKIYRQMRAAYESGADLKGHKSEAPKQSAAKLKSILEGKGLVKKPPQEEVRRA